MSKSASLPRKMVLYSLAKFDIIKTWSNIQWLRRFDLGSFQTSKQIYRKLRNTEKLFRKSQRLPCFPRKMVFYSSSIFCILKLFTNIQSHRRLNLGFWETSKQVYRKLQHGEKIFAKFQSQPCLPRKMVLCSLSKFGIRNAWTNIQWLRRFNLRFLQTSKQIYRKLQYTEKTFREGSTFALLSQKNGFIFV